MKNGRNHTNNDTEGANKGRENGANSEMKNIARLKYFSEQRGAILESQSKTKKRKNTR